MKGSYPERVISKWHGVFPNRIPEFQDYCVFSIQNVFQSCVSLPSGKRDLANLFEGDKLPSADFPREAPIDRSSHSVSEDRPEIDSFRTKT